MTDDKRETPGQGQVEPAETLTRLEEGSLNKRGTEDFGAPPVNLAPAGEGPSLPAQMLDQGTPTSGSTTPTETPTETPSGGATE